MALPPTSVPYEHVVTIRPIAIAESSVPTPESSSSVPQHPDASTSSALSRSLSAQRSLRGIPAAFTSSSSNVSLGNPSSHGPSRPRTSPLNSGLWISIELTITISQIIASIIVLGISRNEHPQAPLHIWVAGYAAGCLATLPLLYLRYAHRHVRTRDHDPLNSSQPTPSVGAGPSSYVTLTPAPQSEMTQGGRQLSSEVSTSAERIGMFVDRFKIALDCFFAIWFVVGNVWIFGGQSAAHDAPNLYRLCIALLTFSCIGYAMPFILCATICCCLPCIIALLGIRDDQNQNRGASQEAISALPTYKFKAKSSNVSKSKSKKDKEATDSDGETPGEGGWVAHGTEKERQVLAEDAVCCICLGQYTDGVELRELPCTHHFHVECVDKWLAINASCPLCKHDIGGTAEVGDTTSTEPDGSSRDQYVPAHNTSSSSAA